MKGLFGGGKKKKGDVPLEEVQKMAAQGMSDKDIIKKLKGQGYSYDSIERAMLQAVKDGVEEPQLQEAEMPSFPELTGPQQRKGGAEPLFPEFEPQEVPEMEMVNPEIIVEELVEGIVEEKWNKFAPRLEKLESEMNLLRTELRQAPKQAQGGGTKDLEAKLAELAEQFDELEARIGGLEKAFKQFLPSLTRNIEALSKMIHEMKEKHGMPEERLLS